MKSEELWFDYAHQPKKEGEVKSEKNKAGNSRLFLFLAVEVSYLLEERGSKDKILEDFIIGGQHFFLVAFPGQITIVQEGYVVAYLHDGVHIVGIDDGCDVVFLGDVMDQFINYKAGLWIKA